jgi:hypothetical protein
MSLGPILGCAHPLSGGHFFYSRVTPIASM